MIRYIISLLLLLFITSLQAAEKSSVTLTNEEKQFLKTHPVIKVQNEDDYPPFDFTENGKAQGYSIEYLNLIAHKTGIKFKYINGYTWSQILDNFKQRKLDIIHTCYASKDRRDYALFTKPYVYTTYALIVKPNSSIRSIHDLKNKRIGIVKGTATISVIKTFYPEINIVELNSPLKVLRMVANKKLDAGLETTHLVNYYTQSGKVSGIELRYFKGKINIIDSIEKKWSIGVRNDWPILMSIINKGMKAMSHQEKTLLKNKWLDKTQ